MVELAISYRAKHFVTTLMSHELKVPDKDFQSCAMCFNDAVKKAVVRVVYS
jgi:hypothetical protein